MITDDTGAVNPNLVDDLDALIDRANARLEMSALLKRLRERYGCTAAEAQAILQTATDEGRDVRDVLFEHIQTGRITTRGTSGIGCELTVTRDAPPATAPEPPTIDGWTYRHVGTTRKQRRKSEALQRTRRRAVAP